MISLYETAASGNSHKIRLMLSLLGLSYQSVPVKFAEREHKSAQFIAMNPFGQIPVFIDGDVVLRDSQAILVYLASRYGNEWLPTDPVEMAQVIAWLSTAANEVARGPMALRLHHKFGHEIDVPAAEEVTKQLLAILEARFGSHNWLALERASIADVAMYPYVALARDGNVDLEQYPAICKWLGRVQALPGYVGMAGVYEAPGAQR